MTGDGHRLRLYERFQQAGIDSFSEHEKLELLLTLVIPRKDCKPLAKDILNHFDNLFDFFYAHPNEWQNINGLGTKTCLFLSVIKALMGETLKQSLKKKKSFKDPQSVAHYLMLKNLNARREVFKILLLNAKYELLQEKNISIGTIDEAPVYIRHIIEHILKYNAKAIILSHNHPSGDPTPSQDDIFVTQKIKKALDLINVELLDHLVIGKNSFVSFANKNILSVS